MKQLRNTFVRAAQSVGVGCLLTVASAAAAPITFTWNPNGVGLTSPGAGVIGPADKITAIDSAIVQLGISAFTETGSLRVNNFLLSAALAPDAGLQSTYSLLFGFTGAGGALAVPSVGTSSTAPFTILNFTLYGLAGPTPTISPTTDVSAVPNVIPLAYGQLMSGTTTLTNVDPPVGTPGPLFSAMAAINMSLQACTAAGQGNTGFGNMLCTGDESAFFANPLPANLSMLIGDFSATTSDTTLLGDTLTINGGGGDFTLEVLAEPVVEPGSLMILGSALLGIGFTRNRRHP